jgi:hypothetical protein
MPPLGQASQIRQAAMLLVEFGTDMDAFGSA